MKLFKKNKKEEQRVKQPTTKQPITPDKKKKEDDLFGWLSGKKKELTVEEVTDIEELLEDDDW